MRDAELTVIGAGLAGSEAAWQAASRGVRVTLIDMKPGTWSPAHREPGYAELVCSNSLRSDHVEHAAGLLKAELRQFGSLLIRVADEVRVPAGSALAVDRRAFSEGVTAALRAHPLITLREELVAEVPAAGMVLFATGPLTDGALFAALTRLLGTEGLAFYDAVAPIVEADSINQEIVFRQSRYDRGQADYLNCPLNREQYEHFVRELLAARRAEVQGFEDRLVFEGCMPIETMAARGEDTLRFGPLRPVGLRDPRTGLRPWAVVQLRQDDAADSLYNLVGFQTRLAFPEQKRVFRLIPGLESAVFARYGVMHRNSYLRSPGQIDVAGRLIREPRLRFAGQLTGVEGYVESIASGLVAGINAALDLTVKEPGFLPGPETVTGALLHYVANPTTRDFAPMNANFGLLAPLGEKVAVRGRKQRREERIRAQVERSLDACSRLVAESPAFPL
ncbi:MAG: methylenetetrahydrofolate--tRNA-(uracil(54)-C(5))-methyltransferase (FADH(2)-oxidizing) TrmFO [Bacillota bacterium]|nr:methylenetetrahydrofolate--tRNA-(uracil(54)-C(5))-methyltransferase (FADH(2)-oxidizing) TrmFO [Bacillota bacterium]